MFHISAVRFGRVPKREKAKILAAMQSSRMKTQESKIMTEMSDDSKIIEIIVKAHYDTCDYTRNKIEPLIQKAKANPSYIGCSGLTCPMKGRADDTYHEQFSERFMDHVRQVCTFAKLIPGFKCLHHDDQVTLLKSCVFEVLLVRLSGLFDSQALVCLNGDLIRKDSITHMPPGNAKFLMDSVFGLAQRMNQFRLSDAEIGLFCAVVIITADRPGLRNPEMVHKMQAKLKVVLNKILLPQHPERATIVAELMTMVHDLRTLNTLHMEKFLQQFKVNSESALEHEVADQKQIWSEQDSAGNESPQSYDTHSSASSVEDCASRRSPMGSISSSESVCTAEIVKLTTTDLKAAGSTLLNALSIPSAMKAAAAAASVVSASSANSSASGGCPMAAMRAAGLNPSGTADKEEAKVQSRLQPHHPAGSSAHGPGQGGKYKSRKLDSPSDSGIDSPRAQGSHSTNTSVCSSPRSSTMEEDKAAGSGGQIQIKEEPEVERLVESRSPKPHQVLNTSSSSAGSSMDIKHEEQHPLLKRALEQPPQPFNSVQGGIGGFQDEVYKPHKKFRRGGNLSGSLSNLDECTSSTGSTGSLAEDQACSLLASQLAEPPKTSYHPQEQPLSLLASTLRKSGPIISPEESKRNEIIANLILEGNTPSMTRPLQEQGLLICAQPSNFRRQPPSSTATSGSMEASLNFNARSPSTSSSSSSADGVGNRHIPIPLAPTKPLHHHPTSHDNSKLASLAAVAVAAAASQAEAQKEGNTGSGVTADTPLNLSTNRKEHKEQDIPTEA